MEDIRKGNDINVSWGVLSNGSPFVLDGLDVSLYLKNTFERKEVSGFAIKGNKVLWTFLGKDQKYAGKHSLELVINEGERGMITTDACNFVNLVNCSCKTGGDPEPNVQIETIELTSTLEYINYDDTELRERIEDLEEKKADKDDLANLATKAELNEKQDTLESGVNIKTINNQSILGEGNITIEGGSGKPYDDTEIKNQLSELEIEVSKKLESEAVASTEPTEDMQFGYDDTEIREGLADLSEETEVLKEAQQFTDVAIRDLQDMKIDRENDDYYPKMAVGLADNLAGVDVVDSEINFRRSGGGAITDGVARIESIKGNSVVWNQRINASRYASKTQNGVTFTNNGDGSISVFTDADGATAKTVLSISELAGFKGHSVVMIGCPKEGSTSTYQLLDPWSGQNDVGLGKMWKHPDNKISVDITINIGTILTTPIAFKPRLFDLTQMFGSGNEPTTIEEFYARIPMGVDMNAYNEGEVIHMDVQSVESQGVNAWDEEWELGMFNNKGEEVSTAQNNTIRCVNPIEVLPNAEYYFVIPNVANGSYMGYAYFYDNEGKYINNAPIAGTAYLKVKTPSNAATLRFSLRSEYGTTYKNDICINLSDTSINGKYFPYIKRVEDLAVIRKYFPNGMKSAGSAHDEIRYNKESGKWEKVVRIEEVDIGTLNFAYSTLNGGYFYCKLEGARTPSSWALVGNLLSGLYSKSNANAIAQSGVTPVNMSIALAPNGTLHVVNTAYTDAASFKAAMAGVILYYELAEPIVTELDAEDQFKDLDYQVWNCGTEKAIAEGKSAPLAADITYGFNAIGKIKELESLVAALRAKVGI